MVRSAGAGRGATTGAGKPGETARVRTQAATDPEGVRIPGEPGAEDLEHHAEHGEDDVR